MVGFGVAMEPPLPALLVPPAVPVFPPEPPCGPPLTPALSLSVLPQPTATAAPSAMIAIKAGKRSMWDVSIELFVNRRVYEQGPDNERGLLRRFAVPADRRRSDTHFGGSMVPDWQPNKS